MSIQCSDCGKFISYKDIEDKIAIKDSETTYDGTEVCYYHKDCTTHAPVPAGNLAKINKE